MRTLFLLSIILKKEMHTTPSICFSKCAKETLPCTPTWNQIFSNKSIKQSEWYFSRMRKGICLQLMKVW